MAVVPASRILGVCAFLLSCASLSAQATIQTVPSALTDVLTKFGAGVPVDSVASATVEITAGSTHTSGTLRVLTRGTGQSAEEWSLPNGTDRRVFSENFVALAGTDPKHEHSFEQSLTAQSPLFPLPWLMAKLAYPDSQVDTVGVETINGADCQHFRLTRTWQSDRVRRAYAKFTEANVWIDTKSGLPAKVSFERRNGWGAVPAIPIAIEYADYKSISGILYPFHIKQYVNGTLWADIQIQDVQFNTGLTASAFTNQ